MFVEIPVALRFLFEMWSGFCCWGGQLFQGQNNSIIFILFCFILLAHWSSKLFSHVLRPAITCSPQFATPCNKSLLFTYIEAII